MIFLHTRSASVLILNIDKVIQHMHLQQKLGYGFILFGIVFTFGMYFAADGGAFLFTALIGLLAIFFGVFQLVIAADAATKSLAKHKIKKARK